MDIPNFTGHSPDGHAPEAVFLKNAAHFLKAFPKAVNFDEQKEQLIDYCLKVKKAFKPKELNKKSKVLKIHYEFAQKVWALDRALSPEDFKKVWKSHLPLP